MIQQAAERLPPVEEAMIRSVLAGGRAKSDALARAGEPLRIDQSIQLGHLRRPQDIVDHQIAVKIEKGLLQLLVRRVHGHLSFRCVAACRHCAARTMVPSMPSALERSEERRVGKEGRSRWSPYH